MKTQQFKTPLLNVGDVIKHEIYCEQRKGYSIINFVCSCGQRGRRRYYKKTFKPLCRKCLREHNKKEKIKTWEKIKRQIEILDRRIALRKTDNKGWTKLLSMPLV